MPAEDSAARSRAFYRALGPAGLAIRTTREWDAQILEALLTLLPARCDALDVGCGYGRIAIPLAERGFNVVGLDIAPSLLRAARREARRRGLQIPFVEASMTEMPLPDERFDAVVSLWSGFYELLAEEEQVAALAEMRRVLRPGGVGVIDGPTFEPPTEERVRATIIAGHRNVTFAHDASTLEARCDAAGITDRTVSEQQWAGRLRQILVFRR